MADFLDRLVGGINKGVATVGANSKAMMEKSRIKSTISNIENERSQLVQLLGQKVYDTYKETGQAPLDAIESFSAQIDQRTEQIALKQEELKRVEEEVNKAIQSASQPKPAGYGEYAPPAGRLRQLPPTPGDADGAQRADGQRRLRF